MHGLFNTKVVLRISRGIIVMLAIPQCAVFFMSFNVDHHNIPERRKPRKQKEPHAMHKV